MIIRSGRLGLLLALLLLPAATSASDPAQPPPKGLDLTSFNVARVQRGDFAPTLRLEGILRSEKLVALRAQTGGLIDKVTVRDGDRVKAGEVLVQIDDRAARLAREAALIQADQFKTKVASAESHLRQAEMNLLRVRRILEAKATPPEEFAQAESRVEEQRHRVREAHGNLKLAELGVRKAELDLEATRIIAPFDGVVLEVEASIGQLVAAATGRLVLLASTPDTLQFRAAVDAATARSLKAGMPLRVAGIQTRIEQVLPIWRDGDEFPGSLVEARVPNREQQLTVLGKATAQIQLPGQKGVLLVPPAALKWRPLPEELPASVREAYRDFKYNPQPADQSLVIRFEQGVLQPIRVEILGPSGDRVAIKGPLKEGDVVILGRAGLE